MKLDYCFTTEVSVNAISEWSECIRKMQSVRDDALKGGYTEKDYRDFIQKATHDAVIIQNGCIEMAFWQFDDPQTMPTDARCDFVYQPTYLIVQTMLCGVNEHPRLLALHEVRCILEKGLNACTGRGLEGAGFDGMSELLQNLRSFMAVGTVEILANCPDLSPEFTGLFRRRINQLYSDIKNGTCVYDWNHDYTDDMRAVLKLFEKHTANVHKTGRQGNS